MSGLPATRVTDQFAHSSAMSGVLVGLAIGIAAGAFIVATGGLGAIAVGAAIGVAGGAGLAGQAIGSTIMGPPTGAITVGSPNVMTNNLQQAATVIGLGPCSKESGAPQAVATGAATVLVNNQPAARKDEKMTCSATIISGSPDVLIGGASVQVLPMEPEVPAALSNTLLAMTIGGTLIATGGIAAAYGVGTAVGSLAGGLAGGHFGGMGGQWAAQQMGFGATGQAIGGVAGGFLGGALGGGAGFRGGRAFDSRYAVTSEGLGANGGNIRITPRPSNTWQKPSSNGAWRNAPNADNWRAQGGTVTPRRGGGVTYQSADGTRVTYNSQGYPDFRPHAVDRTTLPGGFTNRPSDFRAANAQTGRSQYGSRSPPNQTWHHHEDGNTMLLLPRNVHRQFTHAGGIAGTH